MNENGITLVSNDGVSIEVSSNFVEKSSTLTNLISDWGGGEIPVPNYNASELRFILDSFQTNEFPSDPNQLTFLMQGFDFFSLEDELNRAAAIFARYLDGKTTEEMRKILHLSDNLTEEEKTEIRDKLSFLNPGPDPSE